MKIETIYKHFLITPIQQIPVVNRETSELIGLLSKEKILLEMSDLSLSGKTYDSIPSHLIDNSFHENLIAYFQSNRLIPVLSELGEKIGEWDKPRFLAEFSKSIKKEDPKEKHIEKKQEKSQENQIQWFISLILENFPDPLFATDVEGNSIFYNEKFEKEILTKPSFRNSIVFAERFLRDLNRDLFANFLKSNNFENKSGGESNPFLQTYVKQVDRILRVITLEAKEKTVGFLYQFILPGNKLSFMGDAGMSFPSIEEAFHNKLPLEVVLNETEGHYIYYNLKSNQDNISHTAKALGIPRSTLQNRIRQLNIAKKFKEKGDLKETKKEIESEKLSEKKKIQKSQTSKEKKKPLITNKPKNVVKSVKKKQKKQKNILTRNSKKKS